MRRFRTWRRARRAAALLALAAGVALCLAACQAGPGEPQRLASPPSSVLASPEPSVPATSTQAATTAPVLSGEAQAQLDQELVAAAKANNVALVGELIGRGGDVNAKDAIQDSAFLYAGAEGFNDVLRLTLAAGADVASTNRYGGTALIPASEHGHVETVRILLAARVPVNHVNNLGWTAMQEAILLNNGGPRQQDVVRQLLDAGGDPNIRDPQGRTALENAERLGFVEIANLIRGNG
ncbi:ankyrin repeat domain-containing protein [Pseudarthrobacter sp. AL07]|uniref:ankyrin repeat domain-containing protein n=1 Tax=unclassified Pseudarthrobacter TaxID=2647000 RepID=UPI00249B8403|nr:MULTISPECIES: ankyrin repeat domain-containing protein [unclassified Pseudarthrobacter]MDI3194097.1 ankyrin repeat domain-containing protein [Pseudarthrobacter sp. AL20]MDI3207942.1 ankyrin repeat domain-containing protein [Pseudarthrobacter sp. AL07]